MTSNKNFMLRAIELSINSANNKGGPFGCVIRVLNHKFVDRKEKSCEEGKTSLARIILN